MDDTKITGLTNIFLSLFFIVLCIPLAKKKIKMNKWYGMRTEESFKSEENWYKINEYGGKVFIYWLIPLLLIGIVLLFLPPQGNKAIEILNDIPLPLLFIVLPAIQVLIYSKKN